MKRAPAKHKESSTYSGIFRREGKRLFPPSAKNSLPIYLGDSGARFVITGQQAADIVKGNLLITEVNGKLTVSTVIRDKSGQIAAELVENEWKINPNNSFDRNYSATAIEIKDKRGKIVLQVRKDKGGLRLQGIFYSASPKACGIVIADTRAKKAIKRVNRSTEQCRF